jgi:hypothetical protein
VKSGRIVAFILAGAGLLVLVVGGLWLGGGLAEGNLRLTGALLGVGLMVVLIIPLIGAAIYLFVRSGREVAEDEERADLRKILDMVKSRGQLPISDLVLELGESRNQVQDKIHSLVGMGVFSGYINWEEGTLYSEEAAGLRDLERCKYCGGEVKFAGKGVMTCPYCGTEYFLN